MKKKLRHHYPFQFAAALLTMALTGGLLAVPAQAEESFNNSGVQFAEDTIVEFEFIESHGAYRSTFGVVNLTTGEKTPLIEEVKASDEPQSLIVPSTYQDDAGRRADFLGTPGNTVPQPNAEFEFKANTPYAFYLESFLNGQSEQIFYSLNSRNPNNTARIQFQGTVAELGNGGVTLNWDDTGSLLVFENQEDRDFDDFLVRAGGHLACPPFTTSAIERDGTQIVASSCSSQPAQQ